MKNKHLAGVFILVAFLCSQSVYADTYDFSRTFTGRLMDSYTTTWVEETETLSLTSSWDSSQNITKVNFLLSDGGSPWVTGDNDPNTVKNEQFLFYELDLVTNKIDIFTYFNRTLIESHNNIIDITANSLAFSLDHTLLNQLSFPGHSYQGAGFEGDIGIWYYMYGANGNRLETYDVHHGSTIRSDTQQSTQGDNAVPEPRVLLLFLLGVIGMRTFKSTQAGRSRGSI